MSSADRAGWFGTSAKWLQTWPRRYGFAVCLIAAAILVRHALDFTVGPLPPFLLFFPAIMVAAVAGGFGPGVLATFLSAAGVAAFFWAPITTVMGRERELVALTIFSAVGVGTSSLAALYRRHDSRLREFERVVEGLDEMIVVVDRNYRYLIANQAFLRQRAMTKEQVIGRHGAEVLNPEVFDATVKPKLEECFQGKAVRYEMQYEYSALGVRDLLISYFPIAGPKGVDRVACILQDITKLKDADRSLRLFRALIDQSNDGVEVIDPETLRLLDVNERACRDLGYSREELLEMTVYDFDPSVNETTRANDVARLRAGERILKATEHRRKDGSRFPVEASLTWVDLERPYLISVSRDISRRREAEKALRESEDRYRDLIEHSEDLVCTHDLEGRLTSVNPAPARCLGYEVEELLKMSMRELLAPEFRAEFGAYLQRIKTSGADQGLLCVITRSGERRIWEYRNTLRTEGVLEPIVRGMAHDVTERMRAEAALRTSEERYRTLFEKSVAGVVITSVDGVVLDCNDAWARMLGYESPAEIRGRPARAFYFNASEREGRLSELLQNGVVASREMQLRRKDGTPIWIVHNSVVRAGRRGGPVVLQGTAIDITRRKEAEDALRRREEDYRQFVAQSSEGIFREDLDAPLPVDLPEDELVQHILHNSYLAECNDAMARMYGFESSKEFVGKRVSELMVADDPRNIEMTRDYIRAGFRLLERESHEMDARGNPKVFRNSLIGIVDDGKLVRTWGIQRDVTEQFELDEARRQAEQALRASESHFRVLVEQASDGIFVANPNGHYIDVNTAGAEMLGYSREEILARSITDVIAEEELPRLRPEIERFAGGATVRSDWTFRRKDGSFFPGEICGKQLADGRLQGILRDLTERKKADEAIRNSEERFRMALKNSPTTVFCQDCELRYTWLYNPQLYRDQEVLGKTDDELFGKKQAEGLTELKRRVLKTGIASREEIVLPHNGRKLAFDVSIEPRFDAEGKLIGIRGISTNIARLREIADRLQEARDRLAQEKSYLEREIESELGFEEIVGQSLALREVLNQARIVAPTDSTVLLLGETGTGKELVARSVHALSGRREKTFVKLNCAAVPSGLLESELFGHEKGAFTGAVSQKVGRIELADHGTLFLDEIGELPPELQPKLLRVLQDHEFERLGGVQTLRVDVRIIAATNRDLQKDIAEKRFREDLFYRLNVFPIVLPPLRSRREDIPLLVHYFVDKHALRMGKRIEIVPDETMKVLQGWNWPGNIRELENMIERMVILSKGTVLAQPPAELGESGNSADDDLTEMEREHIIRVLRDTRGVLSGIDGAANRLGIKRTTLQSMLKRFGIEAQDYRRATGTFGGE